jgi:hypothetical protein
MAPARAKQQKDSRTMNRNALNLIFVALGVVAVILGYLLYQERQKSGIEINIGEGGVSIEEK